MSRRVLSLCVPVAAVLFCAVTPAAGQIPSSEVQIAAAVMAAPESKRAEATVLGYGPEGELRVLREGSNELVCLGDDPSDDEFSVACYHESLEPYMARGRELRSEGVADSNERNRVRWQEADSGTLSMPDAPANLYVLTGTSFEPATGKVADAYLRYVIYTPWATIEETGLPARPMGPGSPWLMAPGTAGAHIMISPPRTGGGS